MNKKVEKTRSVVDSDVDRTLLLLDEHHEEIDASPYFYTKLMGRIQSDESESMFKSLKGAVILPALLVLILLFNILTMVYSSDEGEVTESVTSPTDISIFLEQYHLTNNR
ncbi:MAG: hypothetical protein KDC73_05705 [Ignavibacteriae bacterium]|nr:hypothetical protein [Ignavibacteriota bacterium]MCB0724177.1 hypothetical protein [Ignavibacteriota bacterium]MCB9243779.1 hypothetical protein [Ignavibacteriales bacterium]